MGTFHKRRKESISHEDILGANSETISVYGGYTEDVVNNCGKIVTFLWLGLSKHGALAISRRIYNQEW